MSTQHLAGVVVAFMLMAAAPSRLSRADDERRLFVYPASPRSETVDDYHGTKVADPFRPLEDPDSPATRAWVEAENKITFDFLDSIPQRAAIRKRLTELWDYEKYSPPTQEGGRYFYTYNTGLQNQRRPVHHRLARRRPGRCSTRIPSRPTARVALAGMRSARTAALAYGIAAAGSDWNEWKVRDVATGRTSPTY